MDITREGSQKAALRAARRDAEYSADVLEGIYDSLEKVSARVLTQDVNDQAAGAALTADNIAGAHDMDTDLVARALAGQPFAPVAGHA